MILIFRILRKHLQSNGGLYYLLKFIKAGKVSKVQQYLFVNNCLTSPVTQICFQIQLNTSIVLGKVIVFWIGVYQLFQCKEFFEQDINFLHMLKRFRKSLFPIQKQHIFTNAQLNTEHIPLNLCRLAKIVKILQNCEELSEALKVLEKCMLQQNHVLKLKTLMTCHYLFKKLGKNQILGIVYQIQYCANNTVANQRFNQSDNYIQIAVITPYKQYLQNLYFKEEIYAYAHKFSSKDQLEHIQIFSKGFQCLNLMEKILRNRQALSKIARYYPNYTQFHTLYMLYVEDLLIFNSFIKWSANKIISYFQKNYKKQSQLNGDKQTLRQIFIFLTECQKSSDCLNQFYFNHYYYSNLKAFFHLPVILNIKMEVFDNIKSKIREIDSEYYKQICPKKKEKNQNICFKTELAIDDFHNLSLEKNTFSQFQGQDVSFQMVQAI